MTRIKSFLAALAVVVLGVLSLMGAEHEGYVRGFVAATPSPEDLKTINEGMEIAAGVVNFAASCKSETDGLTVGSMVIGDQPIALVCVIDPTTKQAPEVPNDSN